LEREVELPDVEELDYEEEESLEREEGLPKVEELD